MCFFSSVIADCVRGSNAAGSTLLPSPEHEYAIPPHIQECPIPGAHEACRPIPHEQNEDSVEELAKRIKEPAERMSSNEELAEPDWQEGPVSCAQIECTIREYIPLHRNVSPAYQTGANCGLRADYHKAQSGQKNKASRQ